MYNFGQIRQIQLRYVILIFSSESVTRSQCTLILLSQSFLNSEYCQQEFDVAYQTNKLHNLIHNVYVYPNSLKISKFSAIYKRSLVKCDPLQEAHYRLHNTESIFF